MKYPHRVAIRAVFVLICLCLIIANVKVFSVGKVCNCVHNDLTETRYDNRRSTGSIHDILDGTSGFMSDTRNSVRNVSNLTSFSDSLNRVQNNVRKQASETEHYFNETDIAKFLSQPVINFHNFSYIHNPNTICVGTKIKVLVVVPSAVDNFSRRQKFRQHFNMNQYRNITSLLFFLGRRSSGIKESKLQQKVSNEIKIYGDVVQEDFEDVYTNNRLKQVSVLRWISTYCSNTKYIIRSDDDIMLNLSELLPVLDRTAQTMDNFIIGRKRENDSPDRRVWKKKFYLSKKEYPPSTFPPYLLGGLLGYPLSTAKLLYQAALRTKPIWLEDVFITGLCAPKVHVPILTDPAFLFKHKHT